MLVEKNENRLFAERCNPLIDTRSPSSVPPEGRHHLALSEMLADKTPQEVIRILVAVKNDDLGDAELGPGLYPGDYLASQLWVRREQPERNETVRLAPAHRLCEIEGSVVAPSREPLDPPLD